MDAEPFSAAKASLRETVKWLATAFSGLAAAVVGGASFVGLGGLALGPLLLALAAAMTAVVCLCLAAGVALRLLTAESFHISELDTDRGLRARLDQYATDVLPPEIESVSEFLALRRKAIDQLRAHRLDPTSAVYLAAQKYLTALDPPLARLVSLAHFERLRMAFDAAIPSFFRHALVALVALAAFAGVIGSHKDRPTAGAAPGPIAHMAIPRDAAPIAAAYAPACAAPLAADAEIIGQPRDGWLTVRLTAPAPCAGLVLAVPAVIGGTETGVVAPAKVATSP